MLILMEQMVFLMRKGGDDLTTMIACLIALLSTVAFVVQWFWVARRELYAKQKMVDAAKHQLTASRQQLIRARGDLGEKQAREILERSLSVYRQSVILYNKTLCKPWNIVPALVLGYRQKNEDEKEENLAYNDNVTKSNRRDG
ncbi:hypothetical protein [Eisenbergiella sp.]